MHPCSYIPAGTNSNRRNLFTGHHIRDPHGPRFIYSAFRELNSAMLRNDAHPETQNPSIQSGRITIMSTAFTGTMRSNSVPVLLPLHIECAHPRHSEINPSEWPVLSQGTKINIIREAILLELLVGEAPGNLCSIFDTDLYAACRCVRVIEQQGTSNASDMRWRCDSFRLSVL